MSANHKEAQEDARRAVAFAVGRVEPSKCQKLAAAYLELIELAHPLLYVSAGSLAENQALSALRAAIEPEEKP
jgi:hypothetical protein